jgi:alanine racemase
MINFLEIDLRAISHNIKNLVRFLPDDVGVIAVVKSNAYGHGLVEVSKTAWLSGADFLAVASLEDAMKLRSADIKAPILVMGYLEKDELLEAYEHGISITVYDMGLAEFLSKEVVRRTAVATGIGRIKKAKVHIKVDTGMHRLGVLDELAPDFIETIINLPGLDLEGIYSHFADVSNKPFSKKQLMLFNNVLFHLQQRKMPIPKVHLANSQAIVDIQDSFFDYVRPGLLIYGLCPSFKDSQPALTFKTLIAQTKTIKEGESVGYGCTWKAPRETMLAVLPVGYADGYGRGLSNTGEVLIGEKRCPVRGRVCMNQTIVDITRVPTRVKIGDEAVLIGKQGNDTIAVEELAKKLETNPHEIVSRLSPSLPRIFKR